MRLPHTLPSSTPREERRARLAPRLVLLIIGFVIFTIAGAVSRAAFMGGDGVDATEQLALLREEVSPLLVFSEFGHHADTVWAADPSDPDRRAYVATIEHSAGFGISASLSPDGTHLAFAVLPAGAAATDLAELWTLAVGTTHATMLAEDVDLLTEPVWSPNSDAVVVRRPVDIETSDILLVDLAGNETTLAGNVEAPYPIEFAPDGSAVYVATLTSAGTDLLSVSRSDGSVATLAKLSDDIARDWSVSPDGTHLAYLAQTSGDTLSYAAQVYDVESGETSGGVAGVSGSQFSPIWHPDGALTVGSSPDTEAAGAMAHVPPADSGGVAGTLAAPEAGFDVPLSWSADGSHLVIRNFKGTSASNPGPSHVVIIDPAGERRQLSAQSDILVIGWLE